MNHNDEVVQEVENHIVAERRSKLTSIRKQKNAFPNKFKPLNTTSDIIKQYDSLSKDVLAQEQAQVVIAGRIMLKRVMGKVSFATLKDNGYNIQIYLNKANLGDEVYDEFKNLDIGDIIGVDGVLFRTKTDELTIEVKCFELIAKSLRPLPEKFHGLTDQEQIYRQRYLDLIMNTESRNVFVARSKIVQEIREILVKENYLEVETPMMHAIPGGATAKPFITHHNTLDMPLFLRVAPELYLKRLIIGGIDRVFEINRNFRNEGISTRHNPEFTMLEFYESYANYQRMMQITEHIIKSAALVSIGTLKFEYQGREVDLESSFDQLTITQAIAKYNPDYTEQVLDSIEFLEQELIRITKSSNHVGNSKGLLHLKLFEETTETKLWNPTYIIDYPVDISPLARSSDVNPEITERFELFVVGRELANGYSELNDPEDQSARFKLQVAQKDSGDEEAMHYDADYINALEYGMPHTGGCGIGIDRLVMLLTNSASIRDVILFPQLATKKSKQ
jgi:lysyl-tRNA synthetase, class II